jgi:hypothetical protein
LQELTQEFHAVALPLIDKGGDIELVFFGDGDVERLNCLFFHHLESISIEFVGAGLRIFF